MKLVSLFPKLGLIESGQAFHSKAAAHQSCKSVPALLNSVLLPKYCVMIYNYSSSLRFPEDILYLPKNLK